MSFHHYSLRTIMDGKNDSSIKQISQPIQIAIRRPELSRRNGIKGRDPFNQNFRKFRSKTQWIGSVQPEKFRKNGSTF